MRTYTSAEVADLVGLPYRRLTELIQKGVLQPKRIEGRGMGNPNHPPLIWTERDLQEARLVTALLSAGVKRKRLPGLLTLIQAPEAERYAAVILFDAATDEHWRLWFLPGVLMERLTILECRWEMKRRGATSYTVIALHDPPGC